MDFPNSKKKLPRYLFLAVLFLCISASFFYGWVLDNSKLRGGKGWADQTAYTKSAIQFGRGELPRKLHFQVGYSLLGALGYYIYPDDPFMPISYILLLCSFFFLFYGAKRRFNIPLSLLFLLMIFIWDLDTITLNYPSELFNTPWNNQVIFFIFCFYFWLYEYWDGKEIPIWLFIITALLSGYAIATREETVFFVIPLAISFLIGKKYSYRFYILFFCILIIGYSPQLIVKYKVLGDILNTGRMDDSKGMSYISKLIDYFSLEHLTYNSIDVLFNSSIREVNHGGRLSILQSNPWFWLTPVGIFYFLKKKNEKSTMKVFVLISLVLLVFYLAGGNMGAYKLRFFCIRYVIPSYIAFNFVIICLLQYLYDRYKERAIRKLLKSAKAEGLRC
jgi:hypothetical protein